MLLNKFKYRLENHLMIKYNQIIHQMMKIIKMINKVLYIRLEKIVLSNNRIEISIINLVKI